MLAVSAMVAGAGGAWLALSGLADAAVSTPAFRALWLEGHGRLWGLLAASVLALAPLAPLRPHPLGPPA